MESQETVKRDTAASTRTRSGAWRGQMRAGAAQAADTITGASSLVHGTRGRVRASGSLYSLPGIESGRWRHLEVWSERAEPTSL